MGDWSNSRRGRIRVTDQWGPARELSLNWSRANAEAPPTVEIERYIQFNLVDVSQVSICFSPATARQLAAALLAAADRAEEPVPAPPEGDAMTANPASR